MNFLANAILGAGLPQWLSGKEPYCNAGDAGDLGSIPVWGRLPGEEERQPTPVFLPGESHGQRNLVGTIHKVEKGGTGLKQMSTEQ